MNYDRKIHITTDQFSDLLGIPGSMLATTLWSGGPEAPRRIGRGYVSGRQQSFYSRAEAMIWMAARGDAEVATTSPHVVPPRDRVPVHEQGVYRPSPQLSVNFSRAGELYGHRLITPVGVGNDREFMHGHEKVRLTR